MHKQLTRPPIRSSSRVPTDPDSLAKAFKDSGFGPILKVADLSRMTGVPLTTIYDWVADGRLDGAIRKRGHHTLVQRDAAIEILFNGPEWDKKVNEDA